MLTQAVYHTLSCFSNNIKVKSFYKQFWFDKQHHQNTFMLSCCASICSGNVSVVNMSWYSNNRCRYGTAFDLSQTFPLSSEQKLGSVLRPGTKLLLPILGLPYKQSWDSCWDG